MKPVVAIVGRPNVGKSTLFNRLLGRRKAIVADVAGLTRDLNFADTEDLGRAYTLVDTGGFEPVTEDLMMEQVKLQTRLAIEEADVIVFLMDAKTGLTPQEVEIAAELRKARKPVVYAVNKIDSPAGEVVLGDFYALGAERVIAISAEHGRNIFELVDAITAVLPEATPEEEAGDRVRVAIVGRPNVGKSSMLNRLIGKKRALVSAVAGTTRDAVDTPFDMEGGNKYLFVDTAGIRKKNRVSLKVEAFSVMEAIRTIDRADVAVLVIDGSAGLMGQDERIAGIIEDKKRCCVIAVNKWDIVEKDTRTADYIKAALKKRLPFLAFAPVVFVSALTGQRVDTLFGVIDGVVEEAATKFPTSKLNTVLKEITCAHRPEIYKGRPLKFYYITQTGYSPPRFALFVNHPEGFKDAYKRYLVNSLRVRLGLERVPIRIVFKERH
ncbi:MAG: ribosome biogenesis GTPase Der [Thermodesulfobacteriota bacterium]|nr:MAG: ribosome biogenesis GTPase Der [Thermodesulfobacteriota bacterium]